MQQPDPKSVERDPGTRGDQDDSERLEIGTDSGEETEDEVVSEGSSGRRLFEKMGPGTPKDRDSIDSVAVVIQSPRPVESVETVVEGNSATTKPMTTNKFVEARKPDDTRDNAAGDDRVVRETQADGASVGPGCWLSCGACCSNTGIKGVPAQVKTTGAATQVFSRTEEHEHAVPPQIRSQGNAESSEVGRKAIGDEEVEKQLAAKERERKEREKAALKIQSTLRGNKEKNDRKSVQHLPRPPAQV